MTFNPDVHHRRSLRLRGYDYSQAGAYFLTICTQDRVCLFGDVVDGKMQLNDAGYRVLMEWNALPLRFPTIELDACVLMPNHIHGIIVNVGAGNVGASNVGAGNVGAGLVPALKPETPDNWATPNDWATTDHWATTRVAPTGGATPDNWATPNNWATTRVAPTVGTVVGAFKSITTVAYIRGVKEFRWPGFRGRLWQRNYYEHVIRDEAALARIRDYIVNNPLQWGLDRENPQNSKPGEP